MDTTRFDLFDKDMFVKRLISHSIFVHVKSKAINSNSTVD